MVFKIFKFPLTGILSFLILNTFSVIFYPGYDKCSYISGSDCKSDSYSFKLNFFSELGSTYTNTDDDYSPLNEGGFNNKKNTISMILFNASLVIVGLSIVTFYNSFLTLFKNDKNKKYFNKSAIASRYTGIATGLMFIGIGLAPHDVNFPLHLFFANGAFLTLFILSIFHARMLFFSNTFSKSYSIGYIIFSFILIIYVIIIFFGPEIGPGLEFSRSELIFQVVAQKVIILIFMFSMLFQLVGIRDILRKPTH
tara:strand:+ start:2247 stop:3005 length:759 start_codon:yes stop_codon:yes gene_type:complete